MSNKEIRRCNRKVNVYARNRKINKIMWTMFVVICACMLCTVVAFADGNDGKDVWNKVINTICPYIIALGAVVAMIGGINWALGFKSEDSDAQVRGIRTLIAGVAVAGVVAATQSMVTL